MMDANYVLKNDINEYARLEYWCDGSEKWSFTNSTSEASRFTHEAAILRSKNGQLPIFEKHVFGGDGGNYVFHEPGVTLLTSGEEVETYLHIPYSKIVQPKSITPVYCPQFEKNQLELI